MPRVRSINRTSVTVSTAAGSHSVDIAIVSTGKEQQMTPMRQAVQTTCLLLWVAYSSFLLGEYSIKFSGSRWAWVALVAAVICLLFSSSLLLRDIWRRARASQRAA